MAELVYREKPLTEDEYNEFEKLFSKKLPLSFKKHYMKNNGGFLAEKDVENDLWGLPIGGFDPIKYGKLPIENLIQDIGIIEDFDTGEKYSIGEFVPFAHDNGGHTIFLSLKEENYGAIYFFDFDGNNLIKLMNNFDEFIKKLYKI